MPRKGKTSAPLLLIDDDLPSCSFSTFVEPRRVGLHVRGNSLSLITESLSPGLFREHHNPVMPHLVLLSSAVCARARPGTGVCPFVTGSKTLPLPPSLPHPIRGEEDRGSGGAGSLSVRRETRIPLPGPFDWPSGDKCPVGGLSSKKVEVLGRTETVLVFYLSHMKSAVDLKDRGSGLRAREEEVGCGSTGTAPVKDGSVPDRRRVAPRDRCRGSVVRGVPGPTPRPSRETRWNK